MTDYFKNTTMAIENYNHIINKIIKSTIETTDVEDEYLTNFALYLAHALIKDYGDGGTARDELRRMARIIIAVLED